MKRSTIDAAELVNECLSLVRPMTADNATRLESEVAPLVFLSDRRLLKQVLINLLTNAIKYNRPQGLVRVSVQSNADGVNFTVSDTGLGIARHRQSELFQSFNRLGAEASDIEGHGIGLVVCQRLVQVLGGTIRAVSEEGVGSSFSVTLPMKGPGDSGMSIAMADTPSPFQFAPSLILNIEDSPANRRLVKGIFAEYDQLELLEAASGETGLEMAKLRRPDLILLDIQLPGIDGIEVLRRLREMPELQNVPVIAISANLMLDYADRLDAAGFDGHIGKPFEVEELMEMASRLLNRDQEPSAA
jgi:CheY-like chemotaxis protein